VVILSLMLASVGMRAGVVFPLNPYVGSVVCVGLGML
jgi:hypothetical protein